MSFVVLVVEGISGIISGEVPERSWLGIVVLIASAVVMPVLWWAKVRVGKALGGDQLILSAAGETKICLMMTAAALIGIALLELTGWGGFDALASFVIACFALGEAKEAWEGELEESCSCPLTGDYFSLSPSSFGFSGSLGFSGSFGCSVSFGCSGFFVGSASTEGTPGFLSISPSGAFEVGA